MWLQHLLKANWQLRGRCSAIDVLACRKLIAIGQSDTPAVLKNLQRLPLLERFAAELFQLFVGKAVPAGADGVDSSAPILSY